MGSAAPAQAPQAGAANPWAAAQNAQPAAQAQGGGFDVWGDMTGSAAKPAAAAPQQAQKDAFSDIWGDFK